ncbi:MAG TPA: hypothetical protein PL033_13600 [Candidatus Brocadiia bacterium]|nr:hypothetical protein [Candidatus Brocadiia bacterium]
MKFAREIGPQDNRLASLDQFRGFTVVGMYFVNYLGAYAAAPSVFKHNDTFCSFADIIMPQFFFAVGLAFRLTFLRAREKHGAGQAYRHAVKRNTTLLLFGAFAYSIGDILMIGKHLSRMSFAAYLSHMVCGNMFQTLVHIAVTSLWVMPVIGAGPLARVIFLLFSGALHAGISSAWYYEWGIESRIIDGGFMGFLSWTIPVLCGSLACDLVMKLNRRDAVRWLIIIGAGIMALGYGLSCLNAANHVRAGLSTSGDIGSWLVEPPFVAPSRPVDMWTMSQKMGSVSYLTFAAGFAMTVYALFVIVCDMRGLRWAIFRTFGQNALMAYIIEHAGQGLGRLAVPRGAPLAFALAGYLIVFGANYLIMRFFEAKRIYLKL